MPALQDTTGYGVEPGEPNTTAPFSQQCNMPWNVGVARTAWYSIHGTGGQITLTTEGSSFDTALFAYAVQVGRACNETGPPKCTDNPPAGALRLVATTVTPDHDADGDGYIGAAFGGPDCDDANPAIHQGARDTPHDGTDQDCDGKDAPYPRLPVSVKISVGYARDPTIRCVEPGETKARTRCS